jgi:hypothetical protein
VLIIERIEAGKRFYVFKKYTQKQLFVGKLPVLSILMIGLWSYMFYFGGLNYSLVQNELINLVSHAKLDDMSYQIVDFFQKRGQLIIYVITKSTGGT